MALYTKKLIMAAFQEMLEEMPFDKITVLALVRRAGVSPNTFYYNYQDIYALLDAWFQDKLAAFIPDGEEFDWKATTKAILHQCKAHAAMIYHVFDGLSRDRLERYIFSLTDDPFLRIVEEAAAGTDLPEERCRSVAAFCRYAYIGFVMQFFWNHMENDIDTSVDRLGSLFETFLASTVRSSE